ncbi:AAA-like domain-containing protein [Microcoleus sp. FACHB-1515]|uniref:WD40 domain-containing protein n=1 Tax=Cyanophyceae TaxID=3028117 RepID=UPI00168445A0|nr:AAA-like domain-containing protein [Microcoleus sp. FACHB-1515]MBD2091564.1 AAA-like domain-containing protein [Microcoleus sp. FACHB-1515]
MRYQAGGSLRSDDPTYVIRQADDRLYHALRDGEFCYVLNSRQMGKSSLLQRTSARLQAEGCACAYLDITQLGSETITPKQWYRGIITVLFHDLNLSDRIDLKQWWQEQADLSSIQQLHQFVEEVLLPNVDRRIFIFVDEIDSLLSLSFPVNDFFAWIRHCYEQRVRSPEFDRLGFALFGVATPSDLIADKRRTPFNIGTAIELHGFQLYEATPLLTGLESHISQPKAVLREILRWTNGQPFLTQKLCQLALQSAWEAADGKLNLPPGTEAFWIEQLVRSCILQNWESQDEPEHLRTIRDRLLFDQQRAGRLLGIYQQILQAEDAIEADDSLEQTQLLLTGLLEKHQGFLHVKNLIYRSIFNEKWVAKQLDNLRPYSQALNAWVASDFQDESRLLRGKALQETRDWTQHKSLSDLDYKFLAASQELERREAQQRWEADRLKAVETRLKIEKKIASLQRFLLAAVCIGLVVSISLGVGSFGQYRQAIESEQRARLSEIQALVSSSNGLFLSDRRLDALIEAIRAKRKLQALKNTDQEIERQVNSVLQQSVYEVDEINRLSGHQAAVLAVDISSDSTLIASGGVDRTIRLWRRDGTEVATLSGHQATVRAVQFSPDGQFIASASDDRTLKIWQRNGKLLRTLQGHNAPVWGVAWSPDGKLLASTSMDGTVKLWRPDRTSPIQILQQGGAGTWALAWSPDGQTIASGGYDRTIKLWKRDGTLDKTLQNQASLVIGLAFSPDGQTIASCGGDKTVKLWSRDGTLLNTLEGHTATINQVTWSPDGQTIASASLDKTVKLWSRDGTLLNTLRGHAAAIWDVAWSRDGSFLASAGTENLVSLWQSDNPFRTIVTAHAGGIFAVDISSDSKTIATGTVGGRPKLWNSQGKLLRALTGDEVGTASVAFSPDNQFLVSAGGGNLVGLWQRDGTLVKTFRGHTAAIWGVAYSPNGNMIASGGDDSTVKLWRPDGTLLKTLTGHRTTVWQVAFSPDGETIASASADGTVKLWSIDGTLLKTLTGHQASVWRVAFSPDGKMLASGSGDSTVKLWSIDGTLLKTFTGHTAAVWGVAFSPDSQRLISGSVDTTLKLWNLDGTELVSLRGHSAALRGVAFSPDKTFVASVSEDNTLIVWDLPKILEVDLLNYGCDRVRDFLRTNRDIQGDRNLCR